MRLREGYYTVTCTVALFLCNVSQWLAWLTAPALAEHQLLGVLVLYGFVYVGFFYLNKDSTHGKHRSFVPIHLT